MNLLRVAILTVSDRSASGEREDLSGPALVGRARDGGWEITAQEIVPDDHERIAKTLSKWADAGQVDLILTTGGTGFGPRDVTPEATQAVVERDAPGVAEAIRAAGSQISPHAMLSRGRAGIRNRTLIINLPGSPKGALESLEVVAAALPHAVQLLRGSAEAEAGHKKGGV